MAPGFNHMNRTTTTAASMTDAGIMPCPGHRNSPHTQRPLPTVCNALDVCFRADISL